METGIKMRVSPEESKSIQEIVFANGGQWAGRDKEVQDLSRPFLFLNDQCNLTYSYDEETFKDKWFKEVPAALFIETDGTCGAQQLYVEISDLKKRIFEKLEKLEKLREICDHVFESEEQDPDNRYKACIKCGQLQDVES